MSIALCGGVEMPAPARTSIGEIVAEGRRIVEQEGLDGLTMQKVARAVGVRAPSLYKHVSGRGELVRLVVEAVLADLGGTLDESISGEDPRADLSSLARAFRSFAHEHPESYQVLFAPMPEEWRPDQAVFVAASASVLRTTEAICGPERALDAARLVTAWAHGFMTMELAGAFRIEGDLKTAFDFGVERLADALIG
jgi:AcrR family transcriptional regulator